MTDFKDSEVIEEEPPVEEVKPEVPIEEVKPEEPVDEIMDAFDKFKKSNSEHTVQEEEHEEESNDFIPNEENTEMFDNFKVKMFMGVFFMLIDGLHLFLFKFFSKHELTKEDISLDETDRESLQMYFETPKIMALINKIPMEFMGIIHLEYLYLNKFREVAKRKDEEIEKEERKAYLLKKFGKKKKTGEPEEEEIEEEEIEGEEKKPPVKRGKYKKRKKRATKKVAPKKKEEKSE